MEKYLYIVYIVSTSESRYSQTPSCSSDYVDANSFEQSVTLSYSGLHWDCLTILIYIPDLQDLCAVILQGWATDIKKSIAVCASQTLVFPMFVVKHFDLAIFSV